MKARGKREARRPWKAIKKFPALKGHNYLGISAFQAWVPCARGTRGDALRACPWLSYSAPLARSFDFEAELRF
jgi:hypothetical protein